MVLYKTNAQWLPLKLINSFSFFSSLYLCSPNICIILERGGLSIWGAWLCTSISGWHASGQGLCQAVPGAPCQTECQPAKIIAESTAEKSAGFCKCLILEYNVNDGQNGFLLSCWKVISLWAKVCGHLTITPLHGSSQTCCHKVGKTQLYIEYLGSSVLGNWFI